MAVTVPSVECVLLWFSSLHLHKKNLLSTCSNPVKSISFFFFSQISLMCLLGDVARMGEGRGVYRVLVGKPEGRRPLGRPRRRWEDNIRVDLREVGCGCVDWMELAQD